MRPKTRFLPQHAALAIAYASSFLLSCSQLESKKSRKAEQPDAEQTAGEADAGLSKEQQAKLWEETVYPLVNGEAKRCAGCHGKDTSPFFASDSTAEGVAAAIDNKKIDLKLPENSRLVQRLAKDAHNCWSDCAENAQEMKTKVADFVARFKEGGGVIEEEAVDEDFKTEDRPLFHTGTGGLKIKIEAEDAEFGDNADQRMLVAFDDATASGGAYVTNGTGGEAVYRFQIGEPGYYWLHFRAKWDDNADIRDLRYGLEGVGLPYHEFPSKHAPSAEWIWSPANDDDRRDEPKQPYYLQAQEYRLVVRADNAQSLVRLDQLALSSDPKFEGATFQPVYTTQMLSFDLTAAVKAKYPKLKGKVQFAIDLESGEEEVYVLKNPRILSTHEAVQAKSLKFRFGKKYLDQYRTFEVVDIEVQAGQYQVLSEASMVILKDKDPKDDTFGFAFESLALISN